MNDDPNAPDNHIQYFGRFEFDAQGNAHHGWNGVYIKANFNGTAISATMLITQQSLEWDVVVDGGEPFIVTQPPSWTYGATELDTVELATGLAPGDHSIEIRKRSETRFVTGVFGEFVVTGGTGLLPPDPVPALAIEFFGDSWLSGHGAGTATSGSMNWPAGVTNGADSWGPVSARALGAEYHLQAYGGMSWAGSSSPDKFMDLCKMSHALQIDLGNQAWDTARWTPDVVVIDMGRNDGHDIATPATWQVQLAEYASFFDWVQAAYGADIPVVIAAQDSFDIYQTVYDTELAAGSHVYMWTNYLAADLGTMVDGHPAKDAHERFAAKFVAFFETEVRSNIEW